MKTCFRLLLLLLAGWTMTGWAGPVTPDEARQKAQAFLAGNVNGNKRMAPRRTGAATLRQVAQTSAYHVFNVGQAGGFVIVSASDQTQPILGYADEGELDPQNVPHALQLWLDDLQRAVTSVDKGIPQRRTLLPGRKLAKRQTKHAVPVLMTCRWNQGDPYNLQTPSYIETKEDGSKSTTLFLSPWEEVKDGKLVYDMPKLKDIAAYAKTEMESFWEEYKRIDQPHIYKVDLSDKLYELKTSMLDEIRKGASH